MRILALQTDFAKLKAGFMSADERELTTAHFHWFKFFGPFMWTGFFTLVVVALGIWLPMQFELSITLVETTLLILWCIVVFPTLLRAYIDWKYDFAVITTDKVVIVDQSSIFRQKITPINLENVSGVSTETQFWNLFHFGTLHLDLTESAGAEHTLRYVKHAHEVAAAVTEALTHFQRRKDLRRYPHGDPKAEEA
jgi:hypothetical protein